MSNRKVAISLDGGMLAQLDRGFEKALAGEDFGTLTLLAAVTQPTTTIGEVSGCLARPARKRLGEARTKEAIRAKLTARNTP